MNNIMSDGCKYLKDEPYYIDLYDLLTIKRCIEVISFWRKSYRERSNHEEIKDLPLKEQIKGFNYFLNWELRATKGERYKLKKATIQKWIEDDRKEQYKYDNTPAPTNIYCSDCKVLMHSIYKHLDSFMDQPLRVLFFFECPKCKKRKSIYDDGEEDVSKPVCPKCSKEVKTKHTKEGNIITWITTCSSCGFTKTDMDDFDKKAEERKKREQEDKELLEKYRADFCLTDEQGKKYIELIEKLEYANKVKEEEIKKYDNSYYPQSLKLKKINIVQLEKLLTESVEKEKYTKFSFDKPEMGQYVIVSFTTQDADADRKEYDSVTKLQKIIKEALENTNWRLMSEGIHYRLGYLSGRLRGYETEEDMLELAGKKKEQQQKDSAEDSEKKMKYGSDPMVHLAKLTGQHIGIENVRKRRLKNEPDGFFLEGEGKYSCGICKEYKDANQIWWDLDGIRCADCQRNLKEGVFPREICKNDDIWLKDWEISSEFSLHSATVRKLKREGILHGRELKTENGSTYCTIYLSEENKEFLGKYPRKPAIKMTYIDPEGNKMEL